LIQPTARDLGQRGFGVSVLTAMTAQNTHAVTARSFGRDIEAQFDAVFTT
jgi:hydroxymethylpyrimidine/phosphomethylpyrimidine kinase